MQSGGLLNRSQQLLFIAGSRTGVLFLIPVPWIAQVWFALLVSLMTILVIAWSCRGEQAR